jgi:hypothetical protein
MKFMVTILSICLTPLLFASGCSKEEPPPPPLKNPKVVKRIIRPPKQVRADRAGSEEGLRPGVEPLAAERPEPEKTPQPEEKAEEMVKPAAPEAGKEEAKDEPGHYVVKKGDTLVRIAGRGDVYGNPLMWPILYRYGTDKLARLATGGGFPERELPEGITIKILTPEEVKENRKKRSGKYWVVNVLSSQAQGEIVTAAVTLLRKGYPVYITRVKVKGKDWMRLRVGFFKNRAEAEREGKTMMAALNFSDSWITKIGNEEFEKFGGY